MTNVLIIGYGQIGQSINKLYCYGKSQWFTYRKDLNHCDELPDKIDIIHICYPYTDSFVPDTIENIKKYSPKLTIIESTIPFLTTDTIYKATKAEIVHSPVMGVHPNLTKSIQTFKKIVAGYTDTAVELACQLYADLGVDAVVFDTPEESELAKLFDTTYYGLCIRFVQEAYRTCEKFNINFDQVYTQTNKIYNEGYPKLGKPNVVRPILKYMGEKGISGHCVTNNALILYREKMLEEITKLIGEVGYKIPYDIDANYKNQDWLFAEYIGKEKSTIKIGEECGVSGITIANWLKKFNIPIRTNKWTEEEKDLLIELAQEMTLKEIANSGQLNKSYTQIRNMAYQRLGIKSIYDPSFRDEETRKKISCTLRNIDETDFDKFMWEDSNRVKRKEYSNWRKEVMKKYDYTCQKTGIKGGKLNVHHIIPWSDNETLRYDINNGIVLSEKSHINFHRKYGYVGCTKDQLEEFLTK